MPLETKRVLVTVKTYPNASKKYGETVCVAGIDLDAKKWIRLYPIPYRDLDKYQMFPKYSIIEVRGQKNPSDTRPESYKVDSDSIRILEHIDTDKGKTWRRRGAIVIPTRSESFCNILEENQKSNKSLGIFKPQNVKFKYKKAKPVDLEERKNSYNQLGLYSRSKRPIEPIPYDFRYSFTCYNRPDCPGHDLMIIDWEIFQAYRQWRDDYATEEILLEKIRYKWVDEMCTDEYDIYFYVGNAFLRRKNFMVLGTFYPRIKNRTLPLTY